MYRYNRLAVRFSAGVRQLSRSQTKLDTSCGFSRNLRQLYDARTIVLRSRAKLSQDGHADVQTWTAKIRLFALRKMNNLGPHADECSVARSLIYVPSLNLYSYLVFASNVGSVKSAHMHRFAGPSIARRCGKYMYILLIKKQKWTA